MPHADSKKTPQELSVDALIGAWQNLCTVFRAIYALRFSLTSWVCSPLAPWGVFCIAAVHAVWFWCFFQINSNAFKKKSGGLLSSIFVLELETSVYSLISGESYLTFTRNKRTLLLYHYIMYVAANQFMATCSRTGYDSCDDLFSVLLSFSVLVSERFPL